MSKRWAISEPDGRCEMLATHAGISQQMAQLLLNRNICNIHKAKEYLAPGLEQLQKPHLLPGLEAAVYDILEAVNQKRKITIWGDYDVDGISGTTILYKALKFLAADVHYYIPSREEGYGLNVQGVEKIISDGTTVIVTVDCGITGIDAATICSVHGTDLIITDHHEWKENLPSCRHCIHPRIVMTPNSHLSQKIKNPYTNPDLCGAGVAFKIAWGLGIAFTTPRDQFADGKVSDEFRVLLFDLMAFAAMGTIADVVSLVGENRVIAHHGLVHLANTPFIGVRALLRVAGFDGKELDGYAVGFGLAPRINAASRMDTPDTAIKLFLGEGINTVAQADELAVVLDQQNRRRQESEKLITEQAIASAEKVKGKYSVVVSDPEWKSGIVGIVASRLVDHFQLPTLVLVETDGELHGSGRSIEGFNLLEALNHCKDLLGRFGGHAMAAGVKLNKKNYVEFLTRFDAYSASVLSKIDLTPSIKIDLEVSLSDLTKSFVQDVKKLGPFGPNNRKPLFIVRSVTPIEVKTIGKDANHLCFQLGDGKSTMKALWFKHGEQASLLSSGQKIDVVFEPTINEFRGSSNVELMIQDLRIA
jgi:single-stranded-DNA-specific exonuclease